MQKDIKSQVLVSLAETRLDTQPIPVADGWAGAEMHVFPTFRLVFTDRPTNQPTHRPTDGRTDGQSLS